MINVLWKFMTVHLIITNSFGGYIAADNVRIFCKCVYFSFNFILVSGENNTVFKVNLHMLNRIKKSFFTDNNNLVDVIFINQTSKQQLVVLVL